MKRVKIPGLIVLAVILILFSSGIYILENNKNGNDVNIAGIILFLSSLALFLIYYIIFIEFNFLNIKVQVNDPVKIVSISYKYNYKGKIDSIDGKYCVIHIFGEGTTNKIKMSALKFSPLGRWII